MWNCWCYRLSYGSVVLIFNDLLDLRKLFSICSQLIWSINVGRLQSQWQNIMNYATNWYLFRHSLPGDHFLFSKHKEMVQWREFLLQCWNYWPISIWLRTSKNPLLSYKLWTNIIESNDYFKDLKKSSIFEEIQKLNKLWTKSIELKADYVEK